MKNEPVIKLSSDNPATEIENTPVIISLCGNPQYVAAGNCFATQLGVRKGMLVELVKYFCCNPIIITVTDLAEIPNCARFSFGTC